MSLTNVKKQTKKLNRSRKWFFIRFLKNTKKVREASQCLAYLARFLGCKLSKKEKKETTKEKLPKKELFPTLLIFVDKIRQ